VNSPGVLGIVLLQAAVAIAVPVFFRRIDHTEGAWRTLVAPVLSAAGMITALYLMVKYIEVVTGASQTVNLVLILTVPAVCVAGLAWALWLRRSKPEVYARVAADEAEAPASAKEAVYALAG
jgi:hypothetical protein